MGLKMINGSVTFEDKVDGYDVSASIQYDANGKVTNVQGGMVRKDSRNVANFNIYYQPNGEFNENHNFYSLTDEEEQIVADIINAFVAEAVNAVKL